MSKFACHVFIRGGRDGRHDSSVSAVSDSEASGEHNENVTAHTRELRDNTGEWTIPFKEIRTSRHVCWDSGTYK